MIKRVKIVAATIIALCMAAPCAYATDVIDSSTSVFTGETAVEYHSYSTYTVSIPTTVSEQASGAITVDMSNIEDGYCLSVDVTNDVDLGFIPVATDDGTKSGKLQMYCTDDMGMDHYNDGVNPLIKFDPEQYDYGNASATIKFKQLLDSPLKAGVYKGIICFRVECVPKNTDNT